MNPFKILEEWDDLGKPYWLENVRTTTAFYKRLDVGRIGDRWIEVEDSETERIFFLAISSIIEFTVEEA